MLWECDEKGCDRPAAWAYVGEPGDLFLCDAHRVGFEDGDWTRIKHEADDS